MQSCVKDMDNAGKEERAIAIEKENVDKDNVPWITVLQINNKISFL